MDNNRQGDVAARIKGQAGEGSQLSSCERLVTFAELRLDRPILAVPGTGDEVDALVECWKIKSSADGRRHVAQQPDVLQLGLILWCGLQIKLCEALECTALYMCRKARCQLAKVAPGLTGSDQAIWVMHPAPRCRLM